MNTNVTLPDGASEDADAHLVAADGLESVQSARSPSDINTLQPARHARRRGCPSNLSPLGAAKLRRLGKGSRYELVHETAAQGRSYE